MKNVIIDMDNNVSDSLKIAKGIFHSENCNRHVTGRSMQIFKRMSTVWVIIFTNLKAARTVRISCEQPTKPNNANKFLVEERRAIISLLSELDFWTRQRDIIERR